MSSKINRMNRENNPPAGMPASPTPQYWDRNTQDTEDVEGEHGAPFSRLLGPGGQPIDEQNPLDVRARGLDDRIGGLDDAPVDAGASGSLSAKLRRLTHDLDKMLESVGGLDANPTLHTLQARLKVLADRLGDASENPDEWTLADRLRRIGDLMESGTAQVRISGTDVALTAPPSTGMKTVTSTAAEVFAGSSRREGRALLLLRNKDASNRVRIGPSGVTDETGFGIGPGGVAQITIDPSADVPIYVVSEAGDVLVEVLEA